MTGPDHNKKILIMAGGTGGHVYPALCIAHYLSGRGMQLEWLGTRLGLEAEVVTRAGFPIHYIQVRGLRGQGLLRKLFGPLVVLWATLQAVGKVRAVRPHCVLGMGGFVTGPGGIAAWLLGKDLLVHEQNAIAGFTNQLLFPFARTVMEAFPEAFERKQAITRSPLLRRFIKPGRTLTVGNPVRADITAAPGPEARGVGQGERLKLLVLGGSLGSVAINRLIPAVLAQLEPDQRPLLRHQCGRRNLEDTRQAYRQQEIEIGDQSQVDAFIEDMAEAYCWADLVICRAGALTVAELANVGVASILVPYPYAEDNHQTENARVLVKAKAAVLVAEQDLSAAVLGEWLAAFDADRNKLLDFARAARSIAQPRATELAAQQCIEVSYA